MFGPAEFYQRHGDSASARIIASPTLSGDEETILRTAAQKRGGFTLA